MNILVTGGAGFIGSHISEFYAKKGYNVTILDNLSREKILGKSSGYLYNLKYLKENFPNITFLKKDIRNFEDIKEIKEIDIIFHTAAQVAVTTSLIDPRTDFEINVLGTFNILELARIRDSCVIFCSTNKVYGENVNKIKIKEEEKRYVFDDEKYIFGISEDFPIDLCAHTPYGTSKLSADIYVQDYAHVYGIKTGVFRMSCIYGERQFGVEDQGWIAWFIIAALTNRKITIYGDGKQVRDVLYVKDLIKAFDKFINSKIKHEVFNIGGGYKNTLSLLELLDILKEKIGKEINVEFSNWRAYDQKVYISDIRKIKRILNWEPEVSFVEGINILIEWVNKNINLFL